MVYRPLDHSHRPPNIWGRLYKHVSPLVHIGYLEKKIILYVELNSYVNSIFFSFSLNIRQCWTIREECEFMFMQFSQFCLELIYLLFFFYAGFSKIVIVLIVFRLFNPFFHLVRTSQYIGSSSSIR